MFYEREPDGEPKVRHCRLGSVTSDATRESEIHAKPVLESPRTGRSLASRHARTLVRRADAAGGHVVADHGAGDDRAGAEDPGDRRPARADGHRQLLPGVAQLGVEAAQVAEELGSELAAGGLNGPGGLADSRIRAV